MDELLIADNPDPDSRLPYLLRLPLAGGTVFRTSGTWPRSTALYCHPMPAEAWPAHPDVVDVSRCGRADVGARSVATSELSGPSEFSELSELSGAPNAPEPSTAEVHAWAVAAGIRVSDRGRLRPEIWDAWRTAHRAVSTTPPPPPRLRAEGT